MTKSYVQLRREIAELEAQALKLTRAEVAGVVIKVKESIESYGLTVEDLFGPRSVASKRGRVTARTKSKKGDAAKYVDGNGNAWVGRGPRPQWLRDALAAGKPLSDFEVGANPQGGRVAPSQKAAAKRGSAGRVKAAGRTKYKDEAGNAWTGIGKRPNWFKNALANGKSTEDLLA
ncbi:H-NS family nucleoid-associated regulatory protein [Methylibium sp.]|uniref:H-NS family nucleoid-associated regulatory protein n=1 Tax=Methylibium sp. TaxID=2067992 RepID=UPI0025FA9E7D|nr:H-NS family nucleoid-associated regulatory protein [Methylibium sp.]